MGTTISLISDVWIFKTFQKSIQSNETPRIAPNHTVAVPTPSPTPSHSNKDLHSSSRPPPPGSIGSCKNLLWQTSSYPQETVLVPSFPGSGAEMFRTLIEGLTGGLPAWSVYNHDNPDPKSTCLKAHAATCKTHWPIFGTPPVVFPDDVFVNGNNNDNNTDSNKGPLTYHSKAIVLLRNPVKAQPSWFNHDWETQNNIGYHVKQAPEQDWMEFANRTLRDRQGAYYNFVNTWAGLSSKRVALFIPYEELTDKVQGPLWARKIVKVLHRAGSRHLSLAEEDRDKISCVWKDIVLDRPTMKRSNHSYTPGYTVEQQKYLQEMIGSLLNGVRKMFGGDLKDGTTSSNSNMRESNATTSVHSTQMQLVSILEMYQKSIQSNVTTRIVP